VGSSVVVVWYVGSSAVVVWYEGSSAVVVWYVGRSTAGPFLSDAVSGTSSSSPMHQRDLKGISSILVFVCLRCHTSFGTIVHSCDGFNLGTKVVL